MNKFTLSDIISARKQAGHLYHEFLHVPTMSMGLYQLAAGASDPQQPHTEDEVYYIVQGQAQIQVGEEHTSLEPGSIVFVAANAQLPRSKLLVAPGPTRDISA